MPQPPLPQLDIRTRAKWRSWLSKHHASSHGIANWLLMMGDSVRVIEAPSEIRTRCDHGVDDWSRRRVGRLAVRGRPIDPLAGAPRPPRQSGVDGSCGASQSREGGVGRQADFAGVIKASTAPSTPASWRSRRSTPISEPVAERKLKRRRHEGGSFSSGFSCTSPIARPRGDPWECPLP